ALPSPILAPDGNRFAAALVPTPELLEREGIGTFRVMFGRTPGRGGVMNLSWEQIPNLNSCMYLSNRLPPNIFGQPRLELHPQVLQVDSDTLRRAIQLTSEMLQDAGYIRDVHLPPL